MRASITLRAAGVIVIGFLCLGGKCGPGTPQQPRQTGDFSISAGFGATSGEACAGPNQSGIVSFTITPQNLTGTQGIDTQQGKTSPLPQFASQVDRDIESGSPIIGCQASTAFLNLKPGTWLVQVSGAGSGSCIRSISAGQNVTVKFWQGVCL